MRDPRCIFTTAAHISFLEWTVAGMLAYEDLKRIGCRVTAVAFCQPHPKFDLTQSGVSTKQQMLLRAVTEP